MCHFEGPAPAGESRLQVADIFRRHGDAFRARHELTPEQSRVLWALQHCRTSAMGGTVVECDQCGYSHVIYCSCGNRHCPTCQQSAQTKWIDGRMERMLDVGHFHVVFTLPAELRPLAFQNGPWMYALLMRSAADVLLRLGQQRLGGQLGVTTVLHTWTREMQFHPHVHCIVTAGVLTPDGEQWCPTKPDYLFPVELMRKLFSGVVRTAIWHASRTEGEIDITGLKGGKVQLRRTLRAIDAKRWVVYVKEPFQGPSSLVAYLGRYTHRVAISSGRLVEVSEEQVTFRTRGNATVTVSPAEFIRRFLLHVLPSGFHKIRHSGLYRSNEVHRRLERARSLVAFARFLRTGEVTGATIQDPEEKRNGGDELDPTGECAVCPRCGVGKLIRRIVPKIRCVYGRSDPHEEVDTS